MKPTTVIVLIVLLVACIGYVVIVRTDLLKPSGAPETPENENQVFAASASEPVKLIIEEPGAETLVFTRRDQAWWMAEPFEAEVEDWRVTDVTRMIANIKYRRAFDPNDPQEGISDERTGLATPAWTLTMVDDEGASFKLHVGKHVPLTRGARTYVRPDGDPKTYVVQMDYHAELRRAPEEYRKTTVLRTEVDQIVRVRVSGSENYELAKTEDDQWQVVAPVRARADKDKVRSFIDRFSYIRAVKFIDDNPEDLAPYGLDEPRLIARIWVKPPAPDEPATTSAPGTQPATAPAETLETYAIECGNVAGERAYAKLTDSPGVFFIELNVMNNLQPPLSDLRSKEILHFKTSEAVGIDLDLPTGKGQLRKPDGKWRMVAPQEGPADIATVNTLLSNLTLPKIEVFHDNVTALGGFGLAPPAATITVHVPQQTQSMQVMIGNATPSGEMTFIRVAGTDSVAVVRTSDVAYLLAPPASYFSPQLLKLKMDERITRLQITRPDGRYKLHRGVGTAWLLSSPVEGRADGEGATRVTDFLKTITASKIVALGRAAPAKYAEAEQKITVNFETSTPAAETQPTTDETEPEKAGQPIVNSYTFHVVLVDGTCYGWMDGRDVTAVGEFSTHIFDDLSCELRERNIWSIRPKNIQNIKRITDAEEFELDRRDKQWVYTRDSYVRIDKKKVSKFLDSIRNIAAEEYVSHASADGGKFGLDEPWFGLELTTAESKVLRLVVSHTAPPGGNGRYASASETEGVFILSDQTVANLTKTLKDFAK